MGKVALVGAGTGDEGLVTIKAMRCIQEADVLVYDRLINLHLLEYCKENCEKINVGKAAGNHTLPQQEINRLLYEKAREGKFVVRLKGGDPFVYGRGGEEAVFLRERDIPFEVVPGVSSLSAVTAYAGIPVTHRGISNEIHVFSGHGKEGEPLQLDFETIAKLRGTLVFYMGLSQLPHIVEGLVDHQMDSDTLIALISKGTFGDQKTIVGTLQDIHKKVEEVASPALIIIGETVKLREQLNWFEEKPLFGKKILITRHKEKNRELRRALEDLGARVDTVETIRFESAGVNMEEVFQCGSEFQYVVFNSAVGVDFFFQAFLHSKKDIRKLGNTRIIAIGEITRQRVEKYLLEVYITFDGSSSEGLIELLKQTVTKEDNILIVTSDRSNQGKYRVLNAYCRELRVMPAYKTILCEGTVEDTEKGKEANYILFHSPSAVESFFQTLNKWSVDVKDKCFISVGTTTKAALREKGIENIHMPQKPNDKSIIDLLLRLAKKDDDNSDA